MGEYSDGFKSLVSSYVETQIEFQNLRPVTVAQWILESGRGVSQLAEKYLNFGGLKWRPEMVGYATEVEYAANDGVDKYCAFNSVSDFIKGYWHFLDRSPYVGWRLHAQSSEEFIRFIAVKYTPAALYPDNVLALVPEATALLSSAGMTATSLVQKPRGTAEPFQKPVVSQFIQSPNYSSRNGERIRRIILHCTTSRNLNGTISHFLNPESQVSAHYVIGRDGTIVQMVRDGDKAWHAKNANADSIGIEHSANPDDVLTADQTKASVALVQWLLSEYKFRPPDLSPFDVSEGIGEMACGIN